VGSLVTFSTDRHQIIGRVIPQSASWLNVMDLKSLHASTPLATPAVSIQHFAAKLPISFTIKPQAGSFGAYPRQIVS
jgi:hypothetical protein